MAVVVQEEFVEVVTGLPISQPHGAEEYINSRVVWLSMNEVPAGPWFERVGNHYHFFRERDYLGDAWLDGEQIGMIRVATEFQRQGWGSRIVRFLVARGGCYTYCISDAGRTLMAANGFRHKEFNKWTLTG